MMNMNKSTHNKIKVLLVEDERIPQIASTQILGECGCVVDVATTGMETLVIVAKNNYQVIFMDIGLRDIDGYEVTRRIQKTGYNVPIIALTAHNDKETEKSCLDAGMVDFLAKPLTIEKIQGIIQKLDLS
jgi:two-component system aerobic respiration control sensor histidine kinase ArcB